MISITMKKVAIKALSAVMLSGVIISGTAGTAQASPLIFSDIYDAPKAVPKKKLEIQVKIDPKAAKKEIAEESKTVKPIVNNKHEITSPFGMRVHPISHTERLHGGNDYKAECGEKLIATEDATVKYSQFEAGGYGWWIQLDTDDESFRYGHMKEKSPIEVGEKVNKGQQIGVVGTTGGSTGCHLHFEELDKNEEKHDPTEYVDEAKVSDILKD